MAAPDIDLIKTWARIDDTSFDAILPMMITGATGLASHACGVDFVAEIMPESVQMWVAAQVSYWVNNPDAAADRKTEQSPFLNGLLDPHRTYA